MASHRSLNHLFAVVAFFVVLPTMSAHARALWVDHESRGGACRDAYTVAENDAAHPWCTLGAAGRNVRAGDVVTVRGGSYSEPMVCGMNPGCSAMCVLELVKKGTAAHPITYQAAAGETPIIEPAGAIPAATPPHGLVYGVCAGITAPVGVCTDTATDCTSDADCPRGGCDRGARLHTVLDGFRFRGWSFYDARLNATNATHVPSQYPLLLHPNAGPLRDVTIRRSEFDHNDGGGVIHAQATGGVTLEYNHVHDNFTHGWTSPVNFWRAVGKDVAPNVARGNTIHDNQDDPPPFCLPRVCGGSTAAKGACMVDAYTNRTAAWPQGYGCACNADSDCESGQCIARDCGPGTGGCECAGDTEGHGIILDMARGTCTPPGGTETTCGWNEDPVCGGAPCALGDAGNFVLESNIIYRNEGDCVSIFKSAGATVRNNVCWQNGSRPSAGELIAFTNRSRFFNNIVVPRSERACWMSANQGVDCTADPSICQGGVCVEKPALALYERSGIFPIRPETNAEGANLLWASKNDNIVQWGGGETGTVAEFAAATAYGTGDIQSDPRFVDPESGDFRLAAGSPALGVADPQNRAPADAKGLPWTGADLGALAPRSAVADDPEPPMCRPRRTKCTIEGVKHPELCCSGRCGRRKRCK